MILFYVCTLTSVTCNVQWNKWKKWTNLRTFFVLLSLFPFLGLERKMVKWNPGMPLKSFVICLSLAVLLIVFCLLWGKSWSWWWLHFAKETFVDGWWWIKCYCEHSRVNRLRKLRNGEDEDLISGMEYVSRLLHV